REQPGVCTVSGREGVRERLLARAGKCRGSSASGFDGWGLRDGLQPAKGLRRVRRVLHGQLSGDPHMMRLITISPARRLPFEACMIASTLLVGACGSGSGAATVTNPVTTPPTVSNYNGPAPQTADVQRFKVNVWDNLVANNRCGTCHNPSQTPRFVRNDDINLAYDAANTVVNLSDPANSRMVLKVRGGHNCWLTSNDACGDIIQSYIEAWAGGSVGGVGKAIQ